VHRLAKLVGGLAGAAAVGGVLSGCGGSPQAPGAANAAPSADAARVEPSDGSVLVRYELTGTAVSIDGNYSEPAGGKERMVDLRATPLPWRRSYTLPPDALFVAGLVAQGPNLESSVTCKIMKDSEIVAQQTGATVDCRAEISK
jgi:hypothetical protein